MNDFEHKNIILKKSSGFQLVITWNSMWKLVPQHSKFPLNTQFNLKIIFLVRTYFCVLSPKYFSKQPLERNSTETADSWNNFWKMNLVVTHSVLEGKFAPSGCKLPTLWCVSSSKVEISTFRRGSQEPCWQSLGGAWMCQGGEGDDAIAAAERGRTSPLDLHHVQAHRWNQNTLWMLLPVTPM